MTAGLVVTCQVVSFSQRALAPGWRWRSSDGQMNCPSAMETRHLFNTLRMIWNNFMPEAARIGQVKLYRFNHFYSKRYLKLAILNIGAELLTRGDLTDEQRRQMNQMEDWLRGAGWSSVNTIPAPLRVLTKE